MKLGQNLQREHSPSNKRVGTGQNREGGGEIWQKNVWESLFRLASSDGPEIRGGKSNERQTWRRTIPLQLPGGGEGSSVGRKGSKGNSKKRQKT